MEKSIKVNGGSFSVSAVLSYPTEDAFVDRFKQDLQGWLTDDERERTLRHVYKVTHELYDGNGNEREVKQPKRARRDKNNAGEDAPVDTGEEPRPDDAGDKE